MIHTNRPRRFGNVEVISVGPGNGEPEATALPEQIRSWQQLDGYLKDLA